MGIMLLAALLAAPIEAQVQTLDGQTVTGQVSQLTGEKLVLTTAKGEQAFTAKELLSVGLSGAVGAAPKDAITLVLNDGSTLIAKGVTAKGDRVTVSLLPDGQAEIPLREIDAVRYREASAAIAQQWVEIAKVDRPDDLIVVRKNDALDSLAGVIKEITPDSIGFELDGEVIRVKLAKVEGLLYHRAAKRPTKAPPSAASVTDSSGSRLRASKLQLEGDKLLITHSGGFVITRAVSDIARLDFAEGNLQYLGELKPESFTWTPYFGQPTEAAREFYRLRVDRAQENGPLRMGGKEYKKGLALHSRSEVVYRVPEEFRTFKALAGIDDRSRPGGDVQLTILGDDKQLFSGRLTGQDDPKELELDIAGVNRLKIIVDFSEDLDLADSLDLCEARILK